MKIEILDTLVLDHDLPLRGLRRGDLGAVVEILPGAKLVVEFVAGSGRTQALVELSTNDVRSVGPDDMPSVRPLGSENSLARL